MYKLYFVTFLTFLLIFLYNGIVKTIDYLTQIYDPGTPIALKDIRIGGKSKSAIKQELYRAYKERRIMRAGSGIYYLPDDQSTLPPFVGFDEIVRKKYVCDDHGIPGFDAIDVYGYYTGLTFLNDLGLSQQVPAIIEITTSRTKANKRVFTVAGSPRKAWIRKAKTDITFENYKILQFLDMFSYATDEEIKNNQQKLRQYIRNNHFSSYLFAKYIGLYGTKTIAKISKGGLLDAFI